MVFLKHDLGEKRSELAIAKAWLSDFYGRIFDIFQHFFGIFFRKANVQCYSKMNLDENKAKILAVDPIQFKLFWAEKYLEDIPTFVPLDIYPQQKVITEMIIECFLFYAVSALDIMFQDINKKLSLGIASNLVNTSKVIEALTNNQTSKANAVLAQIQKYFQKPVHMETIISDKEFNHGSMIYGDDAVGFFTEFENRNTVKYQHSWSRANSRLWELRNQRNLITHESLLKKAGLMGTVPSKNYLRVRLVYNDQPTQVWDALHYENPKEYYTEALNHVKLFINNVQSILR